MILAWLINVGKMTKVALHVLISGRESWDRQRAIGVSLERTSEEMVGASSVLFFIFQMSSLSKHQTEAEESG